MKRIIPLIVFVILFSNFAFAGDSVTIKEFDTKVTDRMRDHVEISWRVIIYANDSCKAFIDVSFLDSEGFELDPDSKVVRLQKGENHITKQTFMDNDDYRQLDKTKVNVEVY